ncbi:MAG: hypothetical protein LUI14_10090 [Lachnospiraceae bacterium]|nr:hypothetical protein [Lachnospiraceae bacterium]
MNADEIKADEIKADEKKADKKKKLYHYTSVEGFEGIINNNSIRMTKSDFLNDPSDCKLFITLVDKYITSHPDVLKDIFSDIGDNSEIIKEIYKNGCDLIQYIQYIHKHISLYVLSLSEIDDGMNMWNYYGKGGFELHFSAEDLVSSLKETLSPENEFLVEVPVIYAKSDTKVEEMAVPAFSEFILKSKDSDNVFEDHSAFIKTKSNNGEAELYKTKKLNVFTKTYIRSYITTLDYLLKHGQISKEMSKEDIFKNVFHNVSKLNDYLYWKHDLSLYMLVLSALIKSDTYKYEEEYRIVYFNYNINPDKTEKKKEEEYYIKHISSGDIICPYITFKNDSTDNLLKNSLKKITVSPSAKYSPISEEIYQETLKKYIISKGFNDIEVSYSQHFNRW